MRYLHALAALVAVIGAAASPSAPAQAADVFVHGRIGDVFVGIDTRDHFGRFDRHRRDRGHRRFFDPFDPRVDRDEFNERLDRRFTYEKLFNGGSSFSHDRRRRALEGWPDRPVRPYYGNRSYDGYRPYYGYRRHERVLPGVLLPEGHYLHDGDSHYEDERGSAAPSAAEAPEPAPAPQAAERPAPDPRGPRWEVSRNPAGLPAVGERLPSGRPYVALDWEDYALPEPPPGHGYVRFDGSVLLIESGSRVVRQIL